MRRQNTYNVFGRKYASGSDFALMAGTDQSKVDIKGLDPGVKYDFYVVGVKENQPGPPSETIVVKAG
ncbi:MAG: fibronectin type III domain-containing protein [Ignavibacteria bacterium]|nr:fibronectin type III domain-containing protein [Bacteroidota bacterium]MBL7127671.1 fibronectin type III domain-containing protein [Ignavibacteria bacterium]